MHDMFVLGFTKPVCIACAKLQDQVFGILHALISIRGNIESKCIYSIVYSNIFLFQ